jgi:hypothetical protein
MTAYEFVNILRDTILDITSAGTLPVVKIGDKYYSTPQKSIALPYLGMFSDGILMPGHSRQAIYNLNLLLQSNTLAMQMPLFVQWTQYGIRLYDGKRWSGFIPIVTTNNKIAIMISKILYPNVRDIYKDIYKCQSIYKEYEQLSQGK